MDFSEQSQQLLPPYRLQASDVTGRKLTVVAVLNPFSGHLESAALLVGKRINHVWHQVLHLIICLMLVGYSVLLPEIVVTS